MSKIVCPYCFETFESKNVWYRCDNPQCKDIKDDKMDQFWGSSSRPYKNFFRPQAKSSIFSRRKMPEYATCPDCKKTTYKTICPYCHNEIPQEMAKTGGFIISIVGARSSGKTNYITTLIREMTKQAYNLGISLYVESVGRDESEWTKNRYKQDFEQYLYTNSTTPPQTDPNDERSKIPLIYRVANNDEKKYGYLVFYDTAGENFNSPDIIKQKANFLRNSDAIIYLIDTFSIEYVQEKLGLPKAEEEYNSIADAVWTYCDNNKTDVKGIFNKPTAFAFSKIDAVINNSEKFENSIPGLDIAKNSPYLNGTGYDQQDIDNISDGIKTILKEVWDCGQFVENMKTYRNNKFFGISALGANPKNGNIDFKIKPYRVMDPVIWILHELDFPMKTAEK